MHGEIHERQNGLAAVYFVQSFNLSQLVDRIWLHNQQAGIRLRQRKFRDRRTDIRPFRVDCHRQIGQLPLEVRDYLLAATDQANFQWVHR